MIMRAPESVSSAPRSSVLSSEAQERKVDQSPQLKRLESFWLAERRALEMIAGGTGLAEILQDLCSAIDAQDPEITSTILLMDADGKRLWPAAGPRVPFSWTERITD
jgi:hypothetical protein